MQNRFNLAILWSIRTEIGKSPADGKVQTTVVERKTREFLIESTVKLYCGCPLSPDENQTMSASNPPKLPDPSECPECDIVIWDGKCNFCRGQVFKLRRFDSGRLAYLSLHDPRAASLCPELTFQQLMEQFWLVTSDGRRYGGADAGRYLSRKLPKLWWLMPLLHVPFSMPFWRWLYRKIAERRYRIAGENCDENGTCDLHHRANR